MIPQTSLYGRVQKIFEKVNLRGADIHIFSPIRFASSQGEYDITLVDEAHLLKVGAVGMQAGRINAINSALFGDSKVHTELDWIMKKSRNVVMVYSDKQRIRQININDSDIQKFAKDFVQVTHELKTQMRSLGGENFIDYVDEMLSNTNRPARKEFFEDFELKIISNFSDFVSEIKRREKEFGPSRMIAGYAWEWKTKRDKKAYDIVIDGIGLRWNSTLTDWLGSKNSADEVGSIYTVQGDDLNYVGLIIGNDLVYRNGRIQLNKDYLFDTGAKNRNTNQIAAGYELTGEDLLAQVLRTYRTLMNRAIQGVYLYVCDDELREYLSQYIDLV